MLWLLAMTFLVTRFDSDVFLIMGIFGIDQVHQSIVSVNRRQTDENCHVYIRTYCTLKFLDLWHTCNVLYPVLVVMRHAYRSNKQLGGILFDIWIYLYYHANINDTCLLFYAGHFCLLILKHFPWPRDLRPAHPFLFMQFYRVLWIFLSLMN